MSGARSGRGLANASGHCHIFPDLEITRSLPGEDPVETGPELVLPIRDIYVEQLVEDHDAHLTNDCHFGVAIDSTTAPFLILSCYRRSERDWLIATLHRVRTARTFPLCPRRD